MASYGTRLFKVNSRTTILCETVNTRYGFRHDAKLLVDGYEQTKAKCCYYNRTWERFRYESVIHLLLEKTSILTEKEKEKFKKTLEKEH